MSLFIDSQNRKNHHFFELLDRSIDDNQKLMTADFFGILKEAMTQIDKSKEQYFTRIREAFHKCNNDRQFFFRSKMD